MTKAFLIDIDLCNGCRNCQISCKDEHCEQAWLPYAEAQPLIGHFWMDVKEETRGQVPVVKISYQPTLCTHCEDAPCMAASNGAIQRRDDGFIIIDPEKAKGMKDLVDSCPLGAIYWNEELSLPQKCTGCAHLLDDGWEVPRCVDSCPTDALRFVDIEDIDLTKAGSLAETAAFGPKVFYLNKPKRFIAGLAFDGRVDEVLIGARIELLNSDNEVVSTFDTDDFGDFKFDQVEPGVYTVSLSSEIGSKTVAVDVTEKDIYVGDIDLSEA